MRFMKALEKTNYDKIIAGLIGSRNQVVRVRRLYYPWAPSIRRLPDPWMRVFPVAFSAGFPV